MGENSNEENKDNSDSSNSKSTDTNRRNFLKYAAAGAIGVGLASAVEIPVLSNMVTGENIDLQQTQTQLQEANNKINQLNSQLQQDQNQINNLQSQVSDFQNQQDGTQGMVTLSIDEQKLVEAIVETIIPSDENGPGAKEAGVIYFIDRQLSGDYGKNANMYMKPPFVLSGQSGPLTVDGITYEQGSPTEPFPGPTYQYNMHLKEFWRYGLEALQSYTNSVYSKNFEDLDAEQKKQVLTDLYNNEPPSFNNIVPKDFFNELIFMTWSGFFMDPLYGGNIGMVGWKLTGFNGPNMGNAYGEGLKTTDLMVADKPTRLQPANLGQFQKSLKIIGGTSQ